MAYATASEFPLQLDRALPAIPGGAPLSTYLPQDPALAVVFWIGLAVIAASVLMLVLILLLRAGQILKQRREQHFIAQWQPLLAECVYRAPEILPPIPRAMQYAFLKLWTYYLESLGGAARRNLVQLANAAGVHAIVRDMILQTDLRKRLIAVVALGHLGDKTRWHHLRMLVADPSPILSLAAARALLEIDTSATLAWLITVIAAREDWPMAKVVSMLKTVGPDRLTLPLIAATKAAAAAEDSVRQVPRLLRLMEVGHSERAAPVVSDILRQASDPEIIAAALRLAQDPRELPMLRDFARHGSWIVRINAVRALSRIGMPEDLKLLTDMLSDDHWWVRYHAARALIALPFTTIKELDMIRAVLPDRYAADMLAEAIAEDRAS